MSDAKVATVPDGTGWHSAGCGVIDLWYQDTPRVNAAYLFDTDDGFAIVETGPASAHAHLMAGIRSLGRDPQQLRHILLTHIHLDHAGGAGTLARMLPSVHVYVHHIGAPHLIDPSNLLRSATRIYGDAMERLWGTTEPVPEQRVSRLNDGAVLTLGGRTFDVVYTPGHASHHVAYRDRATGAVVAGDVAGVRIPPSRLAWPPTPPPDIDVGAWHASIARLRAVAPAALLISHFGVVEREQVFDHLGSVDRHLDAWVAFVEQQLAAGRERDAIVAGLTELARAELLQENCDDIGGSIAMATPYGMSVDGIMRYLRKRGERR
ncbi:MAG: MBL fold metallo-hydrolase [Chloroflexi bacterium]|nr:MAG: MBL fold metallo-hydrolase [Chloroflexota bacterium]